MHHVEEFVGSVANFTINILGEDAQLLAIEACTSVIIVSLASSLLQI